MPPKSLIPILLITVLLLSGCGGQTEVQRWNNTYKFNDYTVITNRSGYCPSIKILKNNDSIFYFCEGEEFGYHDIDTLSINYDTLPDFMFCCDVEDATTVGMFVSTMKSPLYERRDFIELLSPEIYWDIKLSKSEELKHYILMDNKQRW